MPINIKKHYWRTLITFVLFVSSAHGATSSTEEYDFSQLEVKSDDFGSYSIGHNLSTNGRTLKKNQWTVGSLYIANGLTDNLSVGTSAFVLRSFQMFNLMSRYHFKLSNTEHLSFDLAYFKTFGGKIVRGERVCFSYDTDEPPNCYSESDTVYGFHMEAANFKVTYSRQITNHYRFNTTASYFYYFNEVMPFSFRMDPANNDPYTINLTSLHEFKIHDQVFINYELGLWGFNYRYPYIHTGATLNIQTMNWLFGFGASTTYSPGFPAHLAKTFRGYDSRYSIHPEFAVQYFF